ncbi:MAG: anti-sigma factor antagonist [Phycisphaerales bacterium]|nr:anti-sigma factor antagonist [Phycisphaerales bacterium]
MSEETSVIKISEDGDVKKVAFSQPNIIDETTIHQIGKDVLALIDGFERPKLLISFHGVQHMSSAALGVLITCHNRVRVKNGQLYLCDISKQIFEIFKITKLNKMFQIVDTTDVAMKSFK